MKYLVAVSGGVDSVVLLDMLIARGHDVVIGHVDHGIRGEESAADARFVEALAKRYKAPFVSTELHLAPSASEAEAREARYTFLLEQARRYGATLATAHHLDDIVETVAINLTRGTGWRGLAVLGRSDVTRPLSKFTKQQLYDYALQHRLEWVEDRTNQTDDYLRNRIRHRLAGNFEQHETIAALRDAQLRLRKSIAAECDHLLGDKPYISRYVFLMIPEVVAAELLSAAIERAGAPRPTRPRLERALLAIKTAEPRTTHQVGDGVIITFTSRTFEVKAL